MRERRRSPAASYRVAAGGSRGASAASCGGLQRGGGRNLRQWGLPPCRRQHPQLLHPPPPRRPPPTRPRPANPAQTQVPAPPVAVVGTTAVATAMAVAGKARAGAGVVKPKPSGLHPPSRSRTRHRQGRGLGARLARRADVHVSIQIMSYIETSDVLKWSHVCKDWYHVGKGDEMWTHRCHTVWKGKYGADRWFAELARSRQPVCKLYFQSIRESKRTVLTLREVCSFNWQLTLNLDRLRDGSLTPYEAEIIRPLAVLLDTNVLQLTSQSRFDYDGTYRDVNFRKNGPLGGPAKWYFCGSPELGGALSIGGFPPLIVSRTEDWHWDLNNFACGFRTR